MIDIRARQWWPRVTLLSLALLLFACKAPGPTPGPTTTRLPPQSPAIIGRDPKRGQEHSIDKPIAISFDQAMDQASVEAAFSISPQVPGTFQWQGNTLFFAPSDKGFSRATTYRVTLSTQAKSAASLPLAEALSFDVHTSGYLEVTGVQPAPGSKDVSPDAIITVMFNRPVVPLTDVASQTGLALRQPLTFVPPIAGQGTWLNTSIYTFRATPGFLPGTTFQAIVEPERLADVSDVVLAAPFTWEFTVVRPVALEAFASDPKAYIGPSPTISVTFNMPMDHASVEERFALIAEKGLAPFPGQFRWDGKTLGFKPAVPLSLNTRYNVTVATGARADVGGEGTEQKFQWSFTTVEPPRILGTAPQDGSKDVEPYTSLEVTFSSPMSRDSLLPNLTILPKPTEVYTSWNETDTNLWLSFGAKPSTTYTFTFGSDLKGLYGHTLGKPYRVSFATAALAPSVYIPLDRVGTYNAYTTTTAYVQHVNVSELNLALYRLDRAEFVVLNGGNSWDRWEKFQPAAKQLLRKWSTRVSSTLNTYQATLVPLSADGKSALTPGFYYLEVRAPGVEQTVRHMLVVSKANATLKVTMQEALVWTTDLASGQPTPGLDVAVFGPAGEILASGRTDRDGVFFSKLTATEDLQPWDPVLALAGPDDNPCAASTNWADGIAPWQFDLPTEPWVEPYRAYFYTDRSIYRPGQTVYFKGILRADDDGRYGLPDSLVVSGTNSVKSMQVVVRDEMGKEVYRTDLSLNDMGTLHGELTLSDEASLGSYSVNAKVGERVFGTNFRVAEYRKPEFTVSVSTDKEEYVQGDEITVQVAANYYFGGPVANAQLQWRLMTQDSYFYWTGRETYEFTDPDYESRGKQTFYGEMVSTGLGTTDAEGTLSFKLPADVAKRRNSQLFTIEASITDPSNQEVSGRTSAIVHKGLFYVGLAPAEYIGSVGQESKVNVITVDSNSVTVTSIPVTVIFNELKWYNVQEEAGDGRFYWQWKRDETPVYTTTVTTGAAGTALASFRPDKGGSYRVRALARDQRENEIRSSAYLWISSETFVPWRQENNDRIELVTDKKSYQAGDTARILIPSPFQGQVKALLTIERGHIYSHQLLTLASNSDQVQVPILPEYAPNVYVSVVLVKGTDSSNPISSYRVGYVNLSISTAESELTMQISSDQTQPYAPGGKATFDLSATDSAGRGVEAELSFQLVDLSVLALTDSTQGTMLDSFYRQRGLGVRSGATLAISVDRYREQAQPPSGKGGDGGQAGLQLVRQRFLDTAYWNATVRTDAQGKARVAVDLPDNLTTWRATAKAVTADTRVGEGDSEIVTTKDLLVRSIAPRFFVLGDRVQLGAVVHNNTASALTVEALLVGKGVTIEGGAKRTEIAAGGQATVYWEATVTAAPSATLTWSVAAGYLSDALELTLPVYYYSAPEAVATAGQVPAGEARVETIQLPDRLDPTQGELTVQLDPSLAAGMRDALHYLEAYPYHCIEQTVSRFLPNVVTYRALKKLGVANAQLEARLPQYVSVGLQRIYAMQHYDGGWGWWLADDSQPFLSAYVLLGLNEAARAGFAVDGTVIDRAVTYLEGVLDSPGGEAETLDHNSRAFVLYVLAEAGHGDLGRTVALYEKRDLLANYGKAYLLMSLRLLEPAESSRTKALLSDLTNAAVLGATSVHWEEQSTDYWTMNTNTRSTAIVLEALLRSDPQNGLLPNTVRWLMTARKEGHWETTQETAWTVMALTDFMVASGELQADYNYQVALNGQALGQGTVTVQDVAETRKLVVAIQDLLRDEGNRLVLERLTPQASQTGRGQLYYSLYLRYYLPAEDVVAVNRGIVVSRQYALLDRPDQPISSAEVDDVIRVKLTLIAPQDLHYLVLEDPLPAGCEALDTSLKTTSGAYEQPDLERQESNVPYWWYFAHSELRDEKVALFATYLGKGTYEYTYLMRASVPGHFLTMPTYAYEMYFPEVFGRGDGGTFTVSE